MEVLNAKVWDKYQALKKRKVSEAEEVHAEIEGKIRKYQSASEEMLETLRNENDELRSQIFSKEDEFSKSQMLLMEERRKTKELSNELEKLHNLLESKKDRLEENTCEEIAMQISPCCNPELSSKEVHGDTATNQSLNSSVKHRSVENEEANTPLNCPFKEDVTPDCCRFTIASAGNKAESCAEKCVFHSLLESIVGLSFSIDFTADGPHFSISHQSSGCSFRLMWLPNSEGDDGEWLYHVLSLGTLERVALEWMKEDITFSSTMFPLFFQRISRALGRVQ